MSESATRAEATVKARRLLETILAELTRPGTHAEKTITLVSVDGVIRGANVIETMKHKF